MKKTFRLMVAVLAVGASLALVQPTHAQELTYGRPQTASATAGAATLNAALGVVTSESVSTAAGSTYTLTLTNSFVKNSSSVVCAWLSGGTNTAGTPNIVTITPGSGTVAIAVKNQHASAAFNGTLRINYVVLFGD